MQISSQPVKHIKFPFRRVSSVDGLHYFFGYYDLLAWSADGDYHLCHRVSFCDRLPTADDVAELGMIRLSTGDFIPLATTTAWCFQQGAMLQWHPTDTERIIFNTRTVEGFGSVIRRVSSGEERILPLPVANVDPTGRYAVSINFSRMFDFRPGYGYSGIVDPFIAVAQPSDDGIFLLDLATGAHLLILSLEAIAEARRVPIGNAKLLINHITFNTDGTRIIFLARIFPSDQYGWKTAIFTVNLDGSELYLLQDYGYASHYHWRDAGHVLFHSDAGVANDHGELYLFTDSTSSVETIDPAFFIADGHCCYSPDRRWLLYDSYPIDDYRYLYLYDLRGKCGHTLGAFYAPPEITVISHDIRCDLHPRWSVDGKRISFDSLHEGFRGVYVMDLGAIVG